MKYSLIIKDVKHNHKLDLKMNQDQGYRYNHKLDLKMNQDQGYRYRTKKKPLWTVQLNPNKTIVEYISKDLYNIIECKVCATFNLTTFWQQNIHE